VSVRPFRFGVSIRKGASRDDWARKAKKAEELGFSTFLVADHFGDQLATTPALAAAAEATNRIRVGSFVYANDFRHPALLAKEAATLDVLSGGRFELGLGAGWMRSEYERTGVRFDPAGVRIERLGESILVIKRLLAGGPVTFQGRHYSLEQLEGLPRPVQQPYPPILVGGGRRRLLELAAREADIASFAPRSDGRDIGGDDVAAKVRTVREAARERAVELNVVVFEVRRTRARHETTADLARELELPEEGLRDSPHILVGTEAEMAEALVERRERYDLSYVAVFEEAMDALAPVIERLKGR
jgi:probable F420-dependent oxidoreductase